MADRFDASFTMGVELGGGYYFIGKEICCLGCGKMFKKEFDFRRHWRVPIECQVPNCIKTFRDDKLQVYLNHHAEKHSVNGRTEYSQAQLETYFGGMKSALRNTVVRDLCVNKLGRIPEAGATDIGGTTSTTATESTEHTGYFMGCATGSDAYTLNSARETSMVIPSSGNLHIPVNLPNGASSNLGFTQLEYGVGYGTKELQPVESGQPESYLQRQVSALTKKLSDNDQHTMYLEGLLRENISTKQALQRRIEVLKGQMNWMTCTEQPQPQEPLDYDLSFDDFIMSPTLGNGVKQ